MSTTPPPTIIHNAAVERLARNEDRWNAVEVGWAHGEHHAFGEWLNQFWTDDIDPRTHTGYRGEQYVRGEWHDVGPTAISEYGGGSAATYWYMVEGEDCVIGQPNTMPGHWRIPWDQLSQMPEIEDYHEFTEYDPFDEGEKTVP